jgi:hypothetical protein
MIYKLVGKHITIKDGTEQKVIMAVLSPTNDDNPDIDFADVICAAISAGWFEVAMLEEKTDAEKVTLESATSC